MDVFEPWYKRGEREFCAKITRQINPFTPGRAIWPNDEHRNTVELFRALSTDILLNVLKAVFYNSSCFHQSYLAMLPP